MCAVYCSLLPAGRALCPASAQNLCSASLAKDRRFACVWMGRMMELSVFTVTLWVWGFVGGSTCDLCSQKRSSTMHQVRWESGVLRRGIQEVLAWGVLSSSPRAPSLAPFRGLKAEEGCSEPPQISRSSHAVVSKDP